MIDSLLEDIKAQFRYGNMIVKLILVNLFVFVLFTFIGVFTPGGMTSEAYINIKHFFALPGDLGMLLKRPWTIFTHMFLHAGFGHIFWNMLILFWFGRIFGDLMGDQRVLPLYFAGGLAGAIFYLIFANLISPYGGVAMGASAAVMAVVVASGFIAPHYRIHMLFIGQVKLMYIVAALLFFDLAMIGQNNNTGGHFAHLGGALLGGFYITYMHRNGVDFLSGIGSFFEKKPENQNSGRPTKVVKMHQPSRSTRTRTTQTSEETVDRILEKIKISGVSSLTKEEKDVLDRASKE